MKKARGRRPAWRRLLCPAPDVRGRSLLPDGVRPAAVGHRWMVTAPHAAAALVGALIVKDGGSAADAAIAMAASLSVVYPHMSGVGGDLFALYYDARSGEVAAFNGSGAAAELATLDYYAARGLHAIPERGGPAAATVPGAVDGWFAVQERFGRLDMAALLQPAIDLAKSGAPIARSVARSLMEERAWLESDEGARAVFAGDLIGVGDTLVQPALARTLESIARHGRAWFYEGAEVGAAIDRCCDPIDSPLRSSDFAAHRGFWTAPLRGRFHELDSLTTPPNSQGLAMLLAQRVYAELVGPNVPEDRSAQFVHSAVEATKAAYAVRDRYVADPHALPAPLERLLATDFARGLAARIDPNRAAPAAAVRDIGSTTYLACVDKDGNAASVIQSIYKHFGAAVVVPELGVVLHDRGCWFTLDEGAPRSLVPGRRPFHTLMANMLVADGQPTLIYGSMGGDAQPQIGLTVSIRVAERGMDPQAAIEAPRWRWSCNPTDGEPEVCVERRLGSACVAGLRARGHRVTVCGDWEESMGHAGAILIDRERGVLLGGSDPRSDGLAIGG